MNATSMSPQWLSAAEFDARIAELLAKSAAHDAAALAVLGVDQSLTLNREGVE